MSTSKSNHSWITFALVCVTALPGCAGAAPAEDEPIGIEDGAFETIPGYAAFLRSSELRGSSTVSSLFSYSSPAGTNTVTWLRTGEYQVNLQGMGNHSHGNVQVTAVGLGTERCKVWGYGSSSTTVWVNCYSASGAAADALFSLSYVWRNDTPGPGAAYLSTSCSECETETLELGWYVWNSTGSAMTVTHTPGSGWYSVSLPGQNLDGGTVEVTGGFDPGSYCKPANWYATTVNVVCFDSAGAPVDSVFDLRYSKRQPNGTPTASYAWADQPTTSSYHPDPGYSKGLISVDTSSTALTVSTPITITHVANSPGRYQVRFPSMALNRASPSNVIVSAYGWSSETCKLVSWSSSGSDGIANVACYTAAGAPVDALFTVTYSSLAYSIG
jgi:hypothetical protein